MTEPVGQSPEDKHALRDRLAVALHAAVDVEPTHDKQGVSATYWTRLAERLLAEPEWLAATVRPPGDEWVESPAEVTQPSQLDVTVESTLPAEHSLSPVRPPGDEAGLRAALERLAQEIEALPMPSWRDRPSYEFGFKVAIVAAAHAIRLRAALAAKPDQAGLRAADAGTWTSPDEPVAVALGAALEGALAGLLPIGMPAHYRAHVLVRLREAGWNVAALAAEPDQEEPGLDVERLVDILGSFHSTLYSGPVEVVPYKGESSDEYYEHRLSVARALAAEYARLANPDTGS